MVRKLETFKVKKYKDADQAFEAVRRIYEANTQFLREAFNDYCRDSAQTKRVRAYYPYVRIKTKFARRSDIRLSYGFASQPGTYMTTLTSPDIFDEYYREQFRLIIKNHDVPIEVGVSDMPIPLHFALGEDFHLESELTEEKVAILPQFFDVPDLDILDDDIANFTHVPKSDDEPDPLALFIAPRVDLSLQRLKHYCGTRASHFQNYILFTNYQFYIDEFITLCQDMMTSTDDADLKRQRMEYTAFVQPGDKVILNQNIESHKDTACEGVNLSRLPQMPAYHLKRADGSGITMINIGVGPSNAKTITDHVAVLRPHAWLMLGHCAGLRSSQHLGDYVLAHGYLREDQILDEFLPPSIPIPALAEIQQALEKAVSQVTGHEGYDLKKVMRTGTVATTDDRNWELKSYLTQNKHLSQSRAIALDMESGTIAANGFRFRVPYGTLLCVSDKPLHGQLKLPGMADSFYRERVEQHLKIGLLTMTLLRDLSPEKLHSRKLRSFNEPAFQ
ncbi:MAG: AMP nucleosidase [Zetaproteobacteria bacterium]|nr:MAG: AMP nucleosidase [Zetaproteobacteria bacterium]